MKNKLIKLRNAGYKTVALAAGTAAPLAAFATTDEDIAAGFASGETTYQVAITGVIALAAIGIAVGLVLSMMNRS